MGKKGDLLRASKAKKTMRMVSDEWLDEHDRQVRMDTLERKKKELMEFARHQLDVDFAERAELLTGDATDVTLNVFSMLISISCKVLVEQFGWKPIWKHSTRRNRLSRFVVAVKEETEQLMNDELLDIRSYAKRAYDITGVMFEPGEEEEDES